MLVVKGANGRGGDAERLGSVGAAGSNNKLSNSTSFWRLFRLPHAAIGILHPLPLFLAAANVQSKTEHFRPGTIWTSGLKREH
jgi:hypothetical protein